MKSSELAVSANVEPEKSEPEKFSLYNSAWNIILLAETEEFDPADSAPEPADKALSDEPQHFIAASADSLKINFNKEVYVGLRGFFKLDDSDFGGLDLLGQMNFQNGVTQRRFDFRRNGRVTTAYMAVGGHWQETQEIGPTDAQMIGKTFSNLELQLASNKAAGIVLRPLMQQKALNPFSDEPRLISLN